MGNCAYKSNCVWNINCSQTSYDVKLEDWFSFGQRLLGMKSLLISVALFLLLVIFSWSLSLLFWSSLFHNQDIRCAQKYMDSEIKIFLKPPTLRWLVRPVARLGNQRSTVLSTLKQLLVTGFCASQGKASYMPDLFVQRSFQATQVCKNWISMQWITSSYHETCFQLLLLEPSTQWVCVQARTWQGRLSLIIMWK